MNFISQMLSGVDPIMAKVLMYVVAFNVGLTGVKKAVDKIKDRTESQWDNKVSDALGFACGWLSKVLEFASANSSNLPAQSKQEIEKKDE